MTDCLTPAAAASLPPSVVLRQFRIVLSTIRTHFQQIEKAVGIGGAQVWALHAIASHPGLGVNALAQAMEIHQSTASNLVRQLTRRELVHAEKSTKDRRSVRLFVTPAARQLLQRVPGPFQGVLPQALQQLPEQTLTQLQHGLAQLISALNADEKAAGIPLAQL